MRINLFVLYIISFLLGGYAFAQDKKIESMTRIEVKNKILDKIKIPDEVTFYHSNDVDVYAAYDLIVSDSRTEQEQGKTIIMGILDAFDYVKKHSGMRKLEISFFAREKFFDSMRLLKEKGLMDQEFKRLSDEVINQLNLCEERGPNNRAANYAIGALAAAELYPKHPDMKKWRTYAEAVWNDWYIPGDSYEPAYVAHNVPRLIALGVRLGKLKELKSEKLKKAYYRYRDHISSSGLVSSTGDGEPYDQESYVKAFTTIMEVCPDPTILWALKKTYLAGNMKTGRLPEEAFAKAFPQYADSEVKEPEVGAAVQCIFPDTYKSKDRLILAPSREKGAPFAQFWVQDDCNMLYHGGVADTRGDLVHYEVDGTMIITDRGRYEWPAWNNTLLVSEPDAQYPFRETSGVFSGRWYRSSANLRIARTHMPSKDYVINNKKTAGVNYALTEVKNPLGYMWGNPDAIAGKNDLLDLQEVKIEFALLPAAGEKSVGKIFPGRTWFGGYEYRNVCPSDIPVDVYISDLFIGGAKGEKKMVVFDELNDNITFSFTGPDNTQTFTETPLAKEDYAIVTDTETGKKVLRLRTRYGRTILRVKLNEKFSLTEEYSRMGLSYKYVTPIEGWTRVPIQLAINGCDLKYNLRLDRQQGGILTSATVENKEKDSYGSVSYREIWTHDSSWKRRMLLTEEGVLVVLDEFMPGKEADGLVAGPVWHVPSAPQCGDADGATATWFDASLLHYPALVRAFTDKYGEADKKLFITFDAPGSSEKGIQYQPKHWKNDDYAIYSKHVLKAGKPIRWLSVLLPHHKKLDSRKIAKAVKIVNKGNGEYTVRVVLSDKYWKTPSLEILLKTDEQWKVNRTR